MGCGKLGGGVGQDTHLITCAGVRFWVKILKPSGGGSVLDAAVKRMAGVMEGVGRAWVIRWWH